MVGRGEGGIQRANSAQEDHGTTVLGVEVVHPNWLELIAYCQKRQHVSMRLNVADGIPVSAEEVVPHIRFGNSTRRGRIRPVGR